EIAFARRIGVVPDPAIVVKLIEGLEMMRARGSDGNGLGIVIETLPTRTGVAAARCSGIAPYSRTEGRGRGNTRPASKRWHPSLKTCGRHLSKRKQHVVTGRRSCRRIGRGDRNRGTGFAQDIELNQSLVRVKGVSNAGSSHHHHAADVGTL